MNNRQPVYVRWLRLRLAGPHPDLTRVSPGLHHGWSAPCAGTTPAMRWKVVVQPSHPGSRAIDPVIGTPPRLSAHQRVSSHHRRLPRLWRAEPHLATLQAVDLLFCV